MLIERPPEQSDHLEHEDDEAPEHERVHDPRRLLADQELLLAERVDDRRLDPLRDPVQVRRRTRAQEQPGPPGHDPREHQHPDGPEDREDDFAHAREATP